MPFLFEYILRSLIKAMTDTIVSFDIDCKFEKSILPRIDNEARELITT